MSTVVKTDISLSAIALCIAVYLLSLQPVIGLQLQLASEHT